MSVDSALSETENDDGGADAFGPAIGAAVVRYDSAKLGRAQRTPQGFLKIPAYLTRAGVLEYKRTDGKVVRELRPQSEVFAPASLATLSAAPLTDMHPAEMVSADNVRQHAIGHVHDDVRAEGDRVSAWITIQDGNAIAAVERGDRHELSAGYQCQIDPTPGVYNGKAYDQVQRAISYNHIALGPRGWGRAGPEIGLRYDSAHSVLTLRAPGVDDQGDSEVMDMDDGADDAGDSGRHTPLVDGPVARLDGQEFTVGDLIDTIGKVVLERNDLQARLDQARGAVVRIDGSEVAAGDVIDALGEVVIERDELRDELDSLRGERDAAVTQLEALGPRTDGDAQHVRLDSVEFRRAVQEHAALLASAVRVVPHVHFDSSYSARDVYVAVLSGLDPAFKPEGRGDAYLRGRFDSALAAADASSTAARYDAVNQVRAILAPPSPINPTLVARSDSAADYVPDWRKPLSVSAPGYKPV